MFERTTSRKDFPNISIFVTFDSYFYPEGEGPNEDIPQGEDYWVQIDEVPNSHEQIWDESEDVLSKSEQELGLFYDYSLSDWWTIFPEERTSGDIFAESVDEDLPNPHYNGPTSHAWKGACGRHGIKVAAMNAARNG